MIHRYGDRALLVDTDDPVGFALAARELAGVVDAVPGARSVVVVAAADPAKTPLLRDLEQVLPKRSESEPELVTIPVVYDGPDLSAVAAASGLSVTEVKAAHCQHELVVAFAGFVPGFAYLSGLDARLHLPRRHEPRATVPAGSVALAGGWTGVYPRATPGGWHLIGTTTASLWSLDREPEALLRPGMHVRFEEVT